MIHPTFLFGGGHPRYLSLIFVGLLSAAAEVREDRCELSTNCSPGLLHPRAISEYVLSRRVVRIELVALAEQHLGLRRNRPQRDHRNRFSSGCIVPIRDEVVLRLKIFPIIEALSEPIVWVRLVAHCPSKDTRSVRFARVQVPASHAFHRLRPQNLHIWMV